MADAQLIGVLPHVGLAHGVQRLFVGEWVEITLASVEASRRCGQTAVPSRDGAAGIAGFLGPDRGQVLAQARHFGGV